MDDLKALWPLGFSSKCRKKVGFMTRKKNRLMLTAPVWTVVAMTIFTLSSTAVLAADLTTSSQRLAFTKIANDGSTLPASAPLGADAKEWACTRDDQTGLIWEVKTQDGGLRDSKYTYTPYDSNAATNGGWVGYRDTRSGNCVRSLMDGGSCNTEAYVAAVNQARLCGFSDWRLPAVAELVRSAGERSPEVTPITTAAFPNTAEGWYWTGVSRIGETAYSRVILLPPGARAHFYDGSYLVRVVRSPR